MTGSLAAIRKEIADLATDDGDYYVACADTDTCPVPLTGRLFPSEEAAEKAADLTETYRSLLRESDPDLPEYRPVVYERSGDPVTLVSTRERAPGRRANGLPRTSQSVVLSGDGEREWLRMDNAPLVHIRQDGEALPDEAIERQLSAKL